MSRSNLRGYTSQYAAAGWRPSQSDRVVYGIGPLPVNTPRVEVALPPPPPAPVKVEPRIGEEASRVFHPDDLKKFRESWDTGKRSPAPKWIALRLKEMFRIEFPSLMQYARPNDPGMQLWYVQWLNGDEMIGTPWDIAQENRRRKP